MTPHPESSPEPRAERYQEQVAKLLELHAKEKERMKALDRATLDLKFVRAELYDLTNQMIAEAKERTHA